MSRLSEPFRLSILSVLLCFCLPLQASVPKGWLLSGSRPADYETGLDPRVVFNNHQSAYLRSVNSDAPGFGTLMQSISAERYLGKRVRLTAFIKAQNVEDWAGLWMRVDRGNVLAVAFDNMHERAIKGSVDWKSYAVVLDVP